MNPYRNNFNLKPSFKKRSMLKTISWKIQILFEKMFCPEWWIPWITGMIPALLLLFMLAILGILDECGYHILGYKNQEEQQILKEKEEKIQREKDLIKAIEENNRLLKESKNK